jgi:hypothetical protein
MIIANSPGFLVGGLFFALFGVASIVAAITDYRHWISEMYENNQSGKTGLAPLVDTPEGYRWGVGICGVFALVIGIGLIVQLG